MRRRRANARNVSFRISLRWPIHIINPVDKTKLSCYTPHRRSTTVSLETYPAIHAKMCPRLFLSTTASITLKLIVRSSCLGKRKHNSYLIISLFNNFRSLFSSLCLVSTWNIYQTVMADFLHIPKRVANLACFQLSCRWSEMHG